MTTNYQISLYHFGSSFYPEEDRFVYYPDKYGSRDYHNGKRIVYATMSLEKDQMCLIVRSDKYDPLSAPIEYGIFTGDELHNTFITSFLP